MPTEEVFPISKKVKKERSESPPVEKNKRPVSQILAKVRAKEDASWIPRNVKLKQEGKTRSVNHFPSYISKNIGAEGKLTPTHPVIP